MTDTSKSTAVAPAPPAALPEEPSGLLGFGDFPIYSSFPLEQPAARARAIALLQGKHTPLADVIGKTITVEHVLAHVVEVTDQKTGELRGQVRIVLCNGSEAWAATSKGVRDSIRLISQFYGKPPWQPGLKLKVEQVQTRRGYRTFTLTPAV